MRVNFTKDLYFVFGFLRPIDALPVMIQMDPLAVRNRRLARQRPSRLVYVAVDCQFASARGGCCGSDARTSASAGSFSCAPCAVWRPWDAGRIFGDETEFP